MKRQEVDNLIDEGRDVIRQLRELSKLMNYDDNYATVNTTYIWRNVNRIKEIIKEMREDIDI